jgi:hypothetical protein
MATGRRFEAHPQSAPGDFYVVNHECVCCGAPHVVAPDLIGWADPELSHCIWKKQPETKEELEQAFAAFDVADLGCYRYAGTDRSIMERVGAEYCDHAPAIVSLTHHYAFPTEFRVKLLELPGPFRRFVEIWFQASVWLSVKWQKFKASRSERSA